MQFNLKHLNLKCDYTFGHKGVLQIVHMCSAENPQQCCFEKKQQLYLISSQYAQFPMAIDLLGNEMNRAKRQVMGLICMF